MALLGDGALVMWWDIAPEVFTEFEDWHSHEHFPERLAIPGFLRASRWSDGDGGVFVVYELQSYDTLSSAPYLARVNAPSPWSTKMMPHHRNMVRSQCQVRESRGGAVAGFCLNLRLSPQTGQDDSLHQSLAALITQLPTRPGLAGAHLLCTRTPAIAQTTEQKIRGNDRAADWIVLVYGFDREMLQALAHDELSADRLVAAGAAEAPGAAPQIALHRLHHSAVAGDTR